METSAVTNDNMGVLTVKLGHETWLAPRSIGKRSNKIHMHKTRSSSLGNFYIKYLSLSLNQRSFARFGARLCKSYQDKFRQLPKSAFKKHVHDLLFLMMEAEDDYVETPILLSIKLQILPYMYKMHSFC